MNEILRAIPALLVVGACLAQQGLRQRETRYYVIHSDLPADVLREAELRVDLMAAEYAARTRGFAGAVNRKFPFYLFSEAGDYYNAGGLPGSAGVFDGKRLMAIAAEGRTDSTWHVVQHEGFHQFVDAAIGRNLPIWCNEGLAEYFGSAIFTGSDYVCGVVPPDRLKRVQRWIEAGHTASVKEMMTKTHDEWNAQLNLVNYDQAWSMIHFLAHGDGGRYQKAFNKFLKLVSGGEAWEPSWAASFGYGVKSFEARWKEYWSSMEAEHSAELYAEAVVARMTNYLARAVSQKQSFASAGAFFEAARAGELKAHRQDWLPASLLDEALANAERWGEWALERRGGNQVLVLRSDELGEFVGTFQVSGARVRAGSVKVAHEKP